jgi:hypothetical protein
MKVIIHLNKYEVTEAASIVAGTWNATDYTGEEIEVQLKGVNKEIKESVWYDASRIYDALAEGARLYAAAQASTKARPDVH